jgi:hypothetical protein
MAKTPWPGAALIGNQLAIMATNLLLTLQLAAAGGLAAVGAVAPCLLVFQLGSGLMQQVLAEASLLAPSGPGRRLDPRVGGWAMAAALGGGAAGLVLAAAAAALVPGGDPWLGLAFALGLPAAHGLDVGRAAAVAGQAARPATVEAMAWGLTQAVGTLTAGLVAGPLAICVVWTVTNWVYLLGAAVSPARRPRWRGLAGWLRRQRGIAGPASADALLAGLAPLIAIQLSAMVTSAATVGTVRVLQQVLAPLSFVSVSVRKVLIFRRAGDQVSTRRQAIRDGLTAVALVTAGAALLIGALLVARSMVPALAFLPAGAVLILAGTEKVAQGFSFGATLNTFVRRDFTTLLRARIVFFAACAVALPLLCAAYGAPGYLAGAGLAVVVYAVAVLASPSWRGLAPPRPQEVA